MKNARFDGKTIGLVALLGLLPAAAFAVPHVEEAIEVSKGWNLVYIESTPDNAECEAFFADTPVVGAACYVNGADAETAQYDESGREIVQAPVSYLQWIRGESTSTLQAILGGNVFLLYATNAATISFQGVPAAPKTTDMAMRSVRSVPMVLWIPCSSPAPTCCEI